MQLSKRLMKVASYVTEGNRMADIGTDHGYVPIYLVENGIIPSAIAMDINEGPLKKAKEHIENHKLTEKIETRLSDGLKYLGKNEADTVLIAGMGGALTARIMEDGREVLKTVNELVLSPHSEIFKVRKCVLNLGYEITDEDMIIDGGKYYTVIKAIRTGNNCVYGELEEKYGKYLCYKHHQVFREYLDKEYKVFTEVYNSIKNEISESSKKRVKELEHELQLIAAIREGNDCRCQKQ